MRKILEYKVFDILKDKDNVKFLNKVKDENPDLYSKFLTIIGNKGLDIAKEKYKEFDPEEIIKRKKITKKIQRKEVKQLSDKKILDSLKKPIEEITKHLLESPLKSSILVFCQRDPNISKFLNKIGAKKKYTDLFKKILKNPKKFKHELNLSLPIDSLNFNIYCIDDFFDFLSNGDRHLIEIIQRRIWDNSIQYTINFFFADIKEDKNKENEFYNLRNRIINRMRDSGLSYVELFELLKKLSHLLSDQYYEDWKLEQNAKKYNL